MQHRIRAAGIVIDRDRILMVNENEGGQSYWVPPGGGFEAQDGNTSNTVKREVWEESGLTVSVGPLLFVREFFETSKNIYHVEQFYWVGSWSGDLTLKNLEFSSGDERSISDVRWMTRQELSVIKVFPPQLRDLLWDKLAAGDQSIVHLGYG